MQYDEVKKAMFQLLANHWERNFFFCTSPNCDVGEDEKALFQVVANHCGLILPLVQPKMRLV